MPQVWASQGTPTRSPMRQRPDSGPSASTRPTTSWPGADAGVTGRHVALGEMEVGAADAAHPDLHPHLVRARIGTGALDPPERVAVDGPGRSTTQACMIGLHRAKRTGPRSMGMHRAMGTTKADITRATIAQEAT